MAMRRRWPDGGSNSAWSCSPTRRRLPAAPAWSARRRPRAERHIASALPKISDPRRQVGRLLGKLETVQPVAVHVRVDCYSVYSFVPVPRKTVY
ncbi:hypothetical protein EVAR_68972_1 [Eumeta japonica]|uniref:Uncharacterized protein n=1 Tax=Eumeta variegata TaxID=151549 RepID=A0A4C2A4V7_EUMVA|nr:hypothetical protein EVAR_68972_1 [Eumeta japonica]